MFAVYNDQGIGFRSTLENVYRVEGINPAKRVTPLLSNDQDETTGSQSPLTAEAVNAYKKMIQSRREEAIYHAYQIMKRPVFTVGEDTSISECYEMMEAKGIKQFPVLNGDNKPVGLITKENLLKVLLVDDTTVRSADRGSISPLVSRPLISADPVSDIRRVAQVMYECELNCIPVTNVADAIIGIITRTDIVYAVSTYPAITLWA
ncbi:MAG: CBS domain-containing protein [Desulfofustis sp.]|nr:CBS domain-containing protein [Desulfofustis sp.]